MKKRHWLLLFTVFWFSLLYFIDFETWIVLSLPIMVILFIFFFILWLSFMLWWIFRIDVFK
ncbi:hypothetical protein [Capnocytophaga canis]|uniref:hypothetical protein n=1 Tax=Capnocytophaga canis TaxID=1848903 RepID=UPI001BB382B0|nr:hypothetical protein [Capnocytophaga canis]